MTFNVVMDVKDLDQIFAGEDEDWKVEIEFPTTCLVGNLVTERGLQMAFNCGISAESSSVTDEAIEAMTILYEGKVILHGEHAVVYGKKAIACAVNGTIQVDLSDTKDDSVVVQFPNLLKESKECIKVPTSLIQKLHEKHCSEKNHDLWLENLKHFVLSICPHEEKENKLIITALSVLVFAYLKILIEEGQLTYPSLSIRICSHNLPLGSGLGSSAAYSVSLASAFLLYAQQLQLEDEIGLLLDKASLEKINANAYHLEKLVHGKPSGIDNSVSTYGGAIVFTAGQFHHCTNFPKLDFLIVDSHNARSTKALVSSVRSTVDKFPDMMNHVMQSIHEISEAAEKIFGQMSECDNSIDLLPLFDKLKILMKINHHLLNGIGVGHSTLDAIFQLADSLGFSCKLTGAGGGGCVIILLDPLSNEDHVNKLQEDLHQHGFTSWKAILGGEGVKILHYDCKPA